MGVISKVHNIFLKLDNLSTKHSVRNAADKIFWLTKYFLPLITVVSFFLCCDATLLCDLAQPKRKIERNKSCVQTRYVLNKFKKSKKFVDMVKGLGVSKT